MGKPAIKPNHRHRMPRRRDLDHCKVAVLNSLGSPASRRAYEYAIDQLIAWYRSEPRLAFNRIVVVRYRMYLESRPLAGNTINQQLAVVRRLRSPRSYCGRTPPWLLSERRYRGRRLSMGRGNPCKRRGLGGMLRPNRLRSCVCGDCVPCYEAPNSRCD
jgi:hypothetical protein